MTLRLGRRGEGRVLHAACGHGLGCGMAVVMESLEVTKARGRGPKRFHEHLKGLIRLSGLSQGEVARRLGASPAAVSSWCMGKTLPGVKRIPPLASLLGVSPVDLMFGEWASTSRERARFLIMSTGLSPTGLALRVGVSKSMIYHYMRTADQLGSAIALGRCIGVPPKLIHHEWSKP